MIFSVITETPCIVFNNLDGKIEHQYEWVKNLEYIKFINDYTSLETTIDKLLNYQNVVYQLDEMYENYKPLINLLETLYVH
jgi:pyruvyl transferase EpsI